MATQRTGAGGKYYGSLFTESEPLTTSEMETNASYLYKRLHGVHGWSMNAVAATLGNMQAESTINPGRWQSDSVGNYSSGYGLVQWTPATNYTDWCESAGYSDPSEMDAAIARIIYELENKLQYYATSSYPLTFSEFTTSSLDAGTLAKAFLLNYERPADQSETKQEYRASLAENWYTYLSENASGSGSSSPRRRSGFNFVLFNHRNRRLKRRG